MPPQAAAHGNACGIVSLSKLSSCSS